MVTKMITKKDLQTIVDNSAKNLREEISSSAKVLREEISSSAKALREEIKSSADNLRIEFKAEFTRIRKEFKEDIETAVAQVIEAVMKYTASKEDLKAFATKEDLKNSEMKLSNEIKDVKRQINDLNADTPTPQEFQGHEKRIAKLETAVFPL